jgi:hypothetical protein
MNTEGLITAVVARLAAAFANPKFECTKRPDDGNAKPQFTGGQACLWVGYAGSVSEVPEALDHPVQVRNRRISVALFVRKLHGAHGAANMVDAVNEVLHGYQPADGKRLELEQDKFGGFDNGVWRYDLIFRAKCTAIPILEPDVVGPALERVTLIDAIGGDSVIESTIVEEPEEPIDG